MSALFLLLLLEGLVVVYSRKACDTACLASSTEGSLNLACPPGKVILGPKVKVGRNQTAAPCGVRTKGDCVGTTPDVIAGVNNCHWEPNCEIKPNPAMPMISENVNCMGKTPTWATLESYECINNSTLNFVCSDNPLRCNVSSKSGIVASHVTYPWHYPEGPTTCHMTLCRPEGHKLLVRLEDKHLDPENTDNVTFNMISEAGKTKLDLQLGSTETIEKANLEIVFSIGKPTKAGRGFLLRFESVPLGSSTTDIKAKENECERGEKKQKKKKNRGKNRSKGKGRGRKNKKKKIKKKKGGKKGKGKGRNKVNRKGKERANEGGKGKANDRGRKRKKTKKIRN